MTRLIDADTLPRLTQIYEFNGKRMEKEIVSARFIDIAPTIDAVPVRHGRWIEKRGVSGVLGMLVSIRCSVCGCEPVFDSSEHLYNYCPNCGAKMDREETNE